MSAERIDPPGRVMRDMPKAKRTRGQLQGRTASGSGGVRKPPKRHADNKRRAAARARKARHRTRQRRGERVFRLVANEQVVVSGLIDSGKISERDALDHRKVERTLSTMLEQWGKHWTRN